MTSQEKKPTIWTISFWYPPNFSGAGIQAHREHCEFVKSGLPVNVLTAGISAAKPQRGKHINMDGVIVRYFSVIPVSSTLKAWRFRRLSKLFISFLFNLSSLYFVFLCAWTILLEGQCQDILRLEAYNRYAIIPIVVARFKGLHTIVRMSLLGQDDPYSTLCMARHGQILEYLTLASFHMAEENVAICSAMIESCRKVGINDKNVTYISHGIDVDKYQPVDSEDGKVRIRQELGLDIKRKYIIFVGSAIERKGIDVLTDAFIYIHTILKDVDLLIVGPNRFDQFSRFDDLTRQKAVDACKHKLNINRCEEFVHWIGKVENVQEYMQAADVFSLPTRQEGFGLVIAEAMACGLPVVVARLEGVTTDIITSTQSGTLIPGYDYKDYANAIIGILNQPQTARQMGVAARERVISAFSMEQSLRHWKSLFRKLREDYYD